MVLKLRDESTGFGSRPAGRQLRTKCENLLNAEPTGRPQSARASVLTFKASTRYAIRVRRRSAAKLTAEGRSTSVAGCGMHGGEPGWTAGI